MRAESLTCPLCGAPDPEIMLPDIGTLRISICTDCAGMDDLQQSIQAHLTRNRDQSTGAPYESFTDEVLRAVTQARRGGTNQGS